MEAILTAFLALLQHQNFLFLFLFVFRYLRLVVHVISTGFYRPAPIPACRTITEKDCTVIIPTVDPENPQFHGCMSSIITNAPLEIRIVTVGKRLQELTKRIIKPYQTAFPSIRMVVTATSAADKRKQVAHALPHVKSAITFLVDDTVFWPSPDFLRATVAPLENPRVGGVGTNKRVRRENLGFGLASFWNMMGALYLERHNFEIRATNAIDGGVFVISGRTCAYRTNILQDPSFLGGYTNERFFFGLWGPLNADDDNFITRWLVTHGWKIKIQYCKDSTIETVLGTYPKFLSQCLRWSRTTWRSNTASLFTDRSVYRAQPWCVYAVYLTSLVNFALFYDAALVYTLTRTDFYNAESLKTLGMCIVLSKLIKLGPYFCRHPSDLIYLPGYFVFAYFHSFIKLYAGLTFWVTTWGGRDLETLSRCEGSDGAQSSSSSCTSGGSGSGSPDAQNNTHNNYALDGFSEDELPPSAPNSSSRTATHYSSSIDIGSSFTTYRNAASTDTTTTPPAQTRGTSPTTPARRNRTPPVKTPWGSMASGRFNPYNTPANALMDQRPGTTWPTTWIWQTRQSHGNASTFGGNEHQAATREPSPVASCVKQAAVQDFVSEQRQIQLLTPARTPSHHTIDRDGDVFMDTDSTAASTAYYTVDSTADGGSDGDVGMEPDFFSADPDYLPQSGASSATSSFAARDAQLCVFDDHADNIVDSIEQNDLSYRPATPPSSPPTTVHSAPASPTPEATGRNRGKRWNGYNRTWVRGSPDSCNRLHQEGFQLVRPGHCVIQDRRFEY